MDWQSVVRSELRRHVDEPAEDVVLELSQHAAAAFAAARAEGESAEEAHVRVVADLRSWCEARAVHRRRPLGSKLTEAPEAGTSRVSGVWQDVKYAARLLRAERGSTALAVIITALGVGATTTLASIAYGVLARPLPYPDADRLVRVVETRADTTRLLMPILSNGPYQAWVGGERSATIDGLAAFSARTMTFESNPGESGRVLGLASTASLFRVLGSSPFLGNYFVDEHEADGSRDVIVLSHGLWMDRFGGDPAAVGRTVRLDGRPHLVIGVTPPAFVFPDREHRFWIPYSVPPASASSVSMFGSIARLKPGVTAVQASAEATARARTGPQLEMVGIAVFGTNSPPVVNAVPIVEFLAGEVRPALLLLVGAAVLLFLTAVANVSSLQLARSTARRRELATRAALGAGGARLARQMVIEGGLLGLVGGLAGVGLALVLHRVLPSLMPAGFPRLTDIQLDAALVAGALLVSLAAGMAFSLLPALQARRLDLVRALADGGQAPVGGNRRSAVGFMRSAVVVSQVVATTVLLVGAVLFARSFTARWAIDRGYDPAHVLTARLVMPDHAFTPETRADASRMVLARLSLLDGVTSAGLATILPLSNHEALRGFELPPQDGIGQPVQAQAAVRIVTPGFFPAIGARLVAGRFLQEADTHGAPPALVVNEAFVRAYLPNGAAGAKIPTGDGDAQQEIVGVIADMHPRVAGEPPRPEMFQPLSQTVAGLGFQEPSVVLRATGDPNRLAPALGAIVDDIHAAISIESVMSMEARLRAGLGEPRLYSLLVGSFAVLALAIAGAGLFGVVSYSVAARTRELGVRAALGATPGGLVRLVLRQGLGLTVVGVLVGLAIAAAGASFVSGLIYGVGARDPVNFIGVAAALFVLAVVACVVPARRASRVDPLRALRQS